jgi:glutamate-1-semialdehyde 2,1-aminomutase
MSGQHPETYRRLPVSHRPLDRALIERLLAAEWDRYRSTTTGSATAASRAQRTIPLGVPSSFQHWEPYPLAIRAASGAWLTDADDRRVLDLSMGFGAMLVGHLNPVVVDALHTQLATGTLYVTPGPESTDGAERLARRFGIERLRFANSGTEATMYAVRLARAVTGRDGIVKIEGGYHGGYDPLLTSVKPDVALAGPAHAPTAVRAAASHTGELHVVPYNDLAALEAVLTANAGKIAAFVLEPVLENIGIVLPDAGYLEAVRSLCDAHGVLLVFDEVKTGLTAGPAGAAQRLGVTPDLICLAKSIGGGLPLAAFGGRAELMDAITTGKMPHMGTFNGYPLAMAALRAVDELCTAEALAAAEQRNLRALQALGEIIDRFELPAHTVGFGVKGATTFSPAPVRNYRDYLGCDFAAAELSWLWWLNRGVLTPPGLDDQWLVSLAHTDDDMALVLDAFESLARALRP